MGIEICTLKRMKLNLIEVQKIDRDDLACKQWNPSMSNSRIHSRCLCQPEMYLGKATCSLLTSDLSVSGCRVHSPLKIYHLRYLLLLVPLSSIQGTPPTPQTSSLGANKLWSAGQIWTTTCFCRSLAKNEIVPPCLFLYLGILLRNYAHSFLYF